MNQEVGSIAYQARIDTKTLKADARIIEKEIDSVGKKTGKSIDEGSRQAEESLRRFKQFAIGAFVAVGAAVTAFSIKAVKESIKLTESVNAVEKTFGEAADTIFEFGKTADTAAGLSESAFASAVVPIGAMLGNMGYEAEQAAQSSINLAKRAADLASVFNTDLDQALTAIQAGLRGEADPLERFGVGLSEAAVKAYALEEGLIDAGKEMTAQQKTVARLGLFFKQTERFAGDFVDTSDQAANKARILNARYENLSADIGRKLLPVYERLLDAGVYLVDNTDDIINVFRQSIPTVASLSAGIGAFIIVQNAASVATKGLTIAQTALNLVMKANPLALVAGAAVAIGVAYVNASNAANTNANASQRLKAAQDALRSSTDRLKTAQDELTGALLQEEGAALRVERAKIEAKRAIDEFGAGSLEAREAAFSLKLAQDDLARATGNVEAKTKAANNAQQEVVKNQNAIVKANNAIAQSAGGVAGGFLNIATQARQAKQEIQAIQKSGGTVPAQTQLTSGGLPSLNIPQRYKGGSVSAGQPYLVGENKDGSLNSTSEVFVPKTSGSIVSSADVQSAVGGKRVEYNIGTINIDSEVDGERWLRKLTDNQEITSMKLTPQKRYA